MSMFIHFFCLCPLGLPIKLNVNVSKVAYYNETHGQLAEIGDEVQMTTMLSAPSPATWTLLIIPLSPNLGTISAKTFPGFPLAKDKFPDSDTAPLNTRLLYLTSTGTPTPTTAPVIVVSWPSLLIVTDTADV